MHLIFNRAGHASKMQVIYAKALTVICLVIISPASASVLANLAPPAYAAPTSATLTEWTVPTANSGPYNIILDPAGNCCWFAESSGNNVAHFNPLTNTFQEWAIPTASSQPLGIAAATVSGQTAIFGAEGNGNKIFILFPSGNIIKEYTLPTASSFPEQISVEPPGAQERAWFSEPGRNAVGELVYDPSISTADVYEGTLPAAAGGVANGVYAGPGTVWFAGANALVRFDRGTNQFSSWALPSHGSATGAFVSVDTLGQAWYTQDVPNSASDPNNYIGVLRGDGTFKDWQVPSAGADLRGINISPLTQQPWAAEYAHAGSGAAKVAVLDPSTGGTVSYPGLPVTQVFAGTKTTITPAVLGPFPPTSNTVSPTSSSNTGTTTGSFTEWALSQTSGPHDLVVDSSGNVWITESNANKIAELSLSQPDFSIGAAPGTISVGQGASGMITITGTSILSYSGSVTLSITGSVPSGVTFSTFAPNPINIPSGGSAASTLTVNVGPSAAVGSSTITISGTGGSTTHSTSFTLTVTSGADFGLSLSAPTLSVAAGSSSDETVMVTSLGSFNSPVNLSPGSLPSGVHVSFSSNPVTPPAGGTITSTATISVDSGTPAATSTITITGTSGSLTHSQSFMLTITVTPDFTIGGAPGTVSLTQGGTGTSTISVSAINGFNSAVALSYSWIGTAPTGVSVGLPGPVTPTATPATSTLTITASASSSTGSFTVQVTGTSGALIHSANVGVLITTPATTSTSTTSSAAGAPVCLIATATYGSQVAPEVQLLRNFRDNSIMKTQAGSSFMALFNAWYYSFSPGVANYISSHSAERAIMKVVLYPLVGILYLTSNFYSTTASFPELAVLLSGLIASSLIGAFYLGLPLSLIRSRVRRFRSLAAMEKYLSFALLGGISALAIGEALASSTLLMISSATIVLSTLTLAALATSNRVAKLLHH